MKTTSQNVECAPKEKMYPVYLPRRRLMLAMKERSGRFDISSCFGRGDR
jgi:hypothetical protein